MFTLYYAPFLYFLSWIAPSFCSRAEDLVKTEEQIFRIFGNGTTDGADDGLLSHLSLSTENLKYLFNIEQWARKELSGLTKAEPYLSQINYR